MRWLRYCVIAIPALLLAFASASYVVTRLAPGPNFSIAAMGSGFAPLIYADRQLPPSLNDIDTSKLMAVALLSLKNESLNPRALRALALRARSQKKTENILLYAELSQRLSRRDVTNQLLMIDAKATDPATKIEEILVHYDNILRVNPGLAGQLYPALVQVMVDDQALEEIANYVTKKRPWAETLLFEALATEYGPRAVVKILRRANIKKQIDPSDRLSKTLFDRLYVQSDHLTAKSLFLQMKGVEPEWLSSTQFSSARWQDRYGPMVWKFSNDANSGAELAPGRDEANPAVEVFALSGARGAPLRRLIFLNPGNYRFSQEYEVIQSSVNAEASWTLICAGKETASGQTNELFSTSLDLSKGQKNLKSSFDIEITCPIQYLQLSVAGGDSQAGLTIQLLEASFSGF